MKRCACCDIDENERKGTSSLRSSPAMREGGGDQATGVKPDAGLLLFPAYRPRHKDS